MPEFFHDSKLYYTPIEFMKYGVEMVGVKGVEYPGVT